MPVDAAGNVVIDGLPQPVIGSFGSAVLLFGSALVYGATGQISFTGIASSITWSR